MDSRVWRKKKKTYALYRTTINFSTGYKKTKKKTKNKKLVFSSLPLKRQSIYILSQIAQAGRMECSGEQLVDTCVQCYDCADTRSYETDGKLA